LFLRKCKSDWFSSTDRVISRYWRTKNGVRVVVMDTCIWTKEKQFNRRFPSVSNCFLWQQLTCRGSLFFFFVSQILAFREQVLRCTTDQIIDAPVNWILYLWDDARWTFIERRHYFRVHHHRKRC
jgi:hypothetical protein